MIEYYSMKEITILSGKGGTGKTSVTAAFASIAEHAIFCDGDVDAPDLHLILAPEIKETHPFPGGRKASINPELCTDCGLCRDYCRFDAIHQDISGRYYIHPVQCEGCRLCERICPVGAISSEQSMNNFWFVSDTRFGKLVHANMQAGEENSGKLVTTVRNHARELAKAEGYRFIITDGPPGIGCPAIASITGSKAVLMIVEPTRSGMHDAIRLAELVKGFNIPIFSIINKYDVNEEVAAEIESWLHSDNIILLGKIPFNEVVVKAMIEKKSVIEFDPDSELSYILRSSWTKLVSELENGQ
ncbi:MAG: 4Fe-4S binding protein [Bacteroidales bacterium]|nr:4Fe-4S binding protein [Bacteroidales bacterium]MBN2698507.1 4Fe-4S binding protein [Bacteroidales bacterium]